MAASGTTGIDHRHGPGCACGAGGALRGLVRGLVPGESSPWTPPPASRDRRVAATRYADRLLVGDIRPVASSSRSVEALAVTDGRVVATGTLAELDGLRGPQTQVVDLGDGVAYPGLVEPHMHYWVSAMLADFTDCSTRHGATLDEIVGRLRNAAPARGEWVLGRSYDPSLVPGEPDLTRDVLDAAMGDRPTVVINASIHFAYANSAALRLAGLDDDTPDPPGGFFGRTDGRLNGVLGEGGAMGPVLIAIPQPRPGALLDAVVAINAAAVAAGYTRTHDAATGLVAGRAEIDWFHEVAARCPGRISYAIADGAAEAAVSAGLVPGAGDDRCRAVSWKLISDGSNQGRSGYQRQPYLGTDDRGHANFTLEDLAERIALAHRHGWQVMAHANGDAAIDLVLDAHDLAAAAAAGAGAHDGATGVTAAAARDRIEHCSFADPGQLDRMAALGLSPSFLIGHVHYWGDAFAERIVGPDRAARLDPMAGAGARGLRWSLHSDYAVTELEPFRMLQTAVTRRTTSGRVLNADEAVSIGAALTAMTADAAWQVHDDGGGRLNPGSPADVVVVDRDLMTTDPEELAVTTVRRTLVGGEVVHEA